MKKIEYIAPEMEIVKIEYNKILCASNGSEEGDGDMEGGETF
jgi:hypothetical protein